MVKELKDELKTVKEEKNIKVSEYYQSTNDLQIAEMKIKENEQYIESQRNEIRFLNIKMIELESYNKNLENKIAYYKQSLL